MPSLPSSPIAAPSSPGLWQRPAPKKTRTLAQKKVYGKRKVDAPRAVFDQASPDRDYVRKYDGLDEIRLKLEGIKIGDNEEAKKGKKSAKDEDLVELMRNVALNDVPKGEERNEEPPVEEDLGGWTEGGGTLAEPQDEKDEASALKTKPTPKPRRRFEKMVEVRIQPIFRKQPVGDDVAEGKRRSSRRKTPAKRLSSGCVHDERATAYARPILNEAFSPVAAQGVQKFHSWAARASKFEVVKLAEGSYGEVYKLRLREDACKEIPRSKLARLKQYGDGVFKIVPLRAQRGPGSRKFTSIEEIVAEAKMLKYLDPIPGFARFRDIHVVQGRFPEAFQAAWDYYKKTQDDCLNPNPSNRAAYRDSQMWAIVEMDDAGCELEKFSWTSVFQIYDIFWGVAMALARAEEYAMFEVSYTADRRDKRYLTRTASRSSPWECLHPVHTTR